MSAASAAKSQKRPPPWAMGRARMLAVRIIPKSGRTADDVLAYVHLSVAEIVARASALLTMSGLRVL